MSITDWLDRLGMGRYGKAFADNDIDLVVLKSLTNEDLRELGVHSMGHRKIILAAASGVRPAANVAIEAGERRPVAVLFADICGYTALSRRMDAEDLHQLLERFFANVDGAIEDNGGYVDKHVGDSVMGVFGAPIAHGDDALRAVRCAAAILASTPDLMRESGVAVDFHLGLAFGEVVATETGSTHHRSYTVTGNTVNLASRLTDIAKPGCALLSDELRRQIADDANVADEGQVELKGVAEPVQVWRLVSLRPRRSRSSTGFVGRERELEHVRQTLETAAARGAARHVHVRGDAGIGKSRFVEEVVAGAAETGFSPHVVAFHDFGIERRDTPFAALTCDILAAQPPDRRAAILGSSEDGSERAGAGSIGSLVLRDLTGDRLDEFERARLSSINARALNEARADAIATMIAMDASERPQLLVFEDLHWSRSSDWEVIARLFADLAACAVVMLTTTRHDGDPIARPAFGSDGDGVLILELGPLGEADAETIASRMIARDPALLRPIFERSGGNPLFLEHLLRHAASGGTAGLPESIQSVVLAQVDRLTSAQKSLLQRASILGQRSSKDALRFMMAAAPFGLRPLVQRRLLREAGPDVEFSHALVREAVYSSLLGQTRRRLHTLAAEWFADRDVGLHAEHLALAGDSRAGEALVAAATAAIAGNDPDRALALARTDRSFPGSAACELVLVELEARGLLALGRTSESVAVYEKAMASADAPLMRARLALGLAGALRINDQLDKALGLLDDAEPPLEAAGDMEALSALWHLRGNLYFPRGQLTECHHAHEQALAFAERAGAPGPTARALGGLGDAAYAQGRLPTARRRFRESVKLAQEARLLDIVAANASMAAISQFFAGPCNAVLEEALAAARAAAAISNARAEIIACHAIMCVYLWSDRASETKAVFDRCQNLCLRIGARRFIPENLAFLAEAERLQGRHAEALMLLDEALAGCRETGMSYIGPMVLGYLARCPLVDEPRRVAILTEGEALISGGGLAHNILLFGESAIESSLRVGDWDRAEAYAELMIRRLSAESMPFPNYLAARGRALAQHGRGDRSSELCAELMRLAAEGKALGYLTTVTALDAALAEGAGKQTSPIV